MSPDIPVVRRTLRLSGGRPRSRTTCREPAPLTRRTTSADLPASQRRVKVRISFNRVPSVGADGEGVAGVGGKFHLRRFREAAIRPPFMEDRADVSR